MVRCGTVLHHSSLQFQDGTTAAKFLVVLNSPRPPANYLCCKTTSRQKNRPGSPGCHSRYNLFVVDPCSCFRSRTWIQFHEFYEVSVNDLLRLKFNGIISIVGDLDPVTSRSLVECVKSSDDVSPYYLSLLGS